MSTNNDQAKAAWLAKVEQYPSLKKFVEAGDGYVSVCQSIASLYFKSHSRVSSHDGREQNLLSFIKAHPNFETMQGNPTLVLQAMDEFAYQHDFLINIGEHKGKIVTDLIAKVKPKVLVELGGYVGYSAILKLPPLRTSIYIWSLEFDANFAAIASELIKLAGLSDIVSVVVGSADESLRKLKADSKLSSIDFLFLDHVEDLCEQDFKVAVDELKLLKTGAVIVADNVKVPGAPEYRKYVRSREDLRSEAVKGLIMPGELEDELEITYVLWA
ncbi:hypothetical protein LTR09_003542 [Extremus antarcticus]|uniref:catechol O-methyltransferase n=1 Tax=Extremus antarcticus TaxID=702011 RepID=A0AAJ0DK31_9PEZI|nr:hypothetical protein LTR09_003542 [Extremus antarcticus]